MFFHSINDLRHQWAVLTAIAVPIFAEQLEKSREATDLANARTAYADLMAAVITDDTEAIINLYNAEGPHMYGPGEYEAIIPLKQKKEGWSLNKETLDIGGVPSAEWEGEGPTPGGYCHIMCNLETYKTRIYWDSIYYYDTTEYPRRSDVESNPSGNPEELSSLNRSTAESVSNGIINYLNANLGVIQASGLNDVSFTVSSSGHCSFGMSGGSVELLQSLIDQLVVDGIVQKTPASQGTGFYHTVAYEEGEDPYGYKVYITKDENGNINQTHIYEGELAHKQEYR